MRLLYQLIQPFNNSLRQDPQPIHVIMIEGRYKKIEENLMQQIFDLMSYKKQRIIQLAQIKIQTLQDQLHLWIKYLLIIPLHLLTAIAIRIYLKTMSQQR